MQYVCGQMSRAAQKRNPGRGSQRLHRALGGTRILLAAAPTAPPCFCRWQRSSLLHRGFSPAGLFGGSMLFESTRSASLFCKTDKTETLSTRVRILLRLLGGRGWITRAALLKTAHWAVFTLSSATAPQLFESTRPMSLALLQNRKPQYPVLYTLRFFGGAKQPKSEPLPSGASLAVISSKVMVFVPSL